MNKFLLKGSEAQWAMVYTNMRLNLVKKLLKSDTFSNGRKCLYMAFRTKKEAALWLERNNAELAFQSGRLNRWITPTFVISPK